MTAPSGWTVNLAMAAASAALSRLEASGDVDTDEAAALAILREEAPAIDDVIARLLRASEEADVNAGMVRMRIDGLSARRERFINQHNEYRRTVTAILDALGVTKWKNAEYSVSVRPGKPGVVITDETAIPDRLAVTTRTPDKKAIKAALASGEVIPGAELTNGMPILTVRT